MTIANYLHNTQLNKKLTRSRIAALAVLSLFAVIGVFWWLKLIGIAMAGEAFCGMEEHSHGDACTVRTLICTEAEADTHVHEDVCYSLSYTCGKEEHIHTVSCYSDRTADLETARIWEETMRNISRTGNPDADLVSIALTQLGYNESTKNFEVNDSGERNGYTRYGEWYGSPYGKWSAMFVSFCLHYADIPSDAAPYRSGCETMRLAWDDRGFILAATNYVPIAGDIVFLDNDANGNADAVGIVCETANDQITVIEGDYENAVCQTVYDLTDSRILDYGSLVEIVRGMATEEDLVRVESVIQKIDALPSYETVDNTLTQYDDANDLDGYLGYWNEISEQVKETYILWQGLDKFRLLVPNSAHLGELNWTWSTQILPANDTDSIVVRQINKSATGGSGLAAPIVVYGGTIANKLSGNVLSNMLYWDAYVIEQSDKGLYVAQIVRSGTAKGSLKASTSNGFVLLVHDDYDAESRDFSAEVGDWITVDFNYKTTGAYKASGYGTVTRTASNTAKLSTVESADTRDLIEVNLYNYTDKVNTNYNNDKLYPGFQNPGGLEPSISTDMTAIENLSGGGFDFGDNITADTGIATVTKAATAQGINKIYQSANLPISLSTQVMSPALINGYPALANGNSLQYLFTTSSANGVTKQNKQSINGLFQYDSKTGSYYFDSRNNHAQYDAATDTFTLYQQLITSNFIMYPFGNFLPFNDIRTEATYTPAIARGWFVQMRENAAAKYASTKNSEYNDLYTVLNAFITRMDEEGTWDYETLIETYFSTSGITLPGDASSQMSNIYSVDFDEETDFFFGMDMHLEFMQPKGGLTGSDGKQPMVYEFTGDDDVWVYIDGALFLDLSGIHRHVGGKIDFVNGIVYYYKMDPTVGDITNTVVQQYTFRELLKAGGYTDAQIDTLLNDKGTFKDYSEHKLDFYYMERGSGSSVCRMNFNLPLLQKNRISVTKELENNLADALGNPDFMFQVYKSGGKQLLIGEGVTYTVLDANGNVIATKTTGTNGVFTLKAGQTAVFGDILENAGRYFVRELINEDFIKQYGTVSVDGTSVTVNRDVTVGNDTFKGFDSPEKDMSDGSTTFIFTNTVDRLYYGSLEIQKTSNEYTILPENKQFVFALSFDGTPVPAGTKYTLIDADGNETTGTIITAGQLVLFAGQSARFEQILAGTEIFLQEIDSSDYIVTYTATNITLTEDTVNGSVTGRINADQTAQIVVFNDKKGTKLPIVGDKTLLYPNGKDQTYTFILKELVGPDDLTAFLANGTYLESTVTLQDSSIGFTFTLNYPADTASGTRYYLIWEKDADEKAGMDTTKYIVQVAVTSTNGVVSAEIEQIYQNSTATAVDAIAFVNKNVQSLTVHKNVERSDALDRAFRFDLTAILPDGTPISGIFSCEGVDGMTTITLTNGSASFYLKHGESLTIYGLPYGAKWTVTEEKTAGFYTESGTTDTDLSENNAVGGTLTADADAYFVNIGGKELPSTGGYSYYPYLFGGMFLTACSLIIGYVSRRKRERRAL